MSAYCWIATAICMTGTVANVYRRNLCFILWAVGEVMWVGYDASIHFWSRLNLDLLGLTLALWGAWVNIVKPKIKKKKENAK